ncbi:MAG: PDZ domain-containing protein [Planctomycetales bacterium]|nr:PDZ domain-containing protein [Planctomycetales bacterium]
MMVVAPSKLSPDTHGMRRVGFLSIVGFLLAGLFTVPVAAQGYLDQLEQIIRNRLTNPNAEVSPNSGDTRSEELPAPKRPPESGSSVESSSSNQDRISILEGLPLTPPKEAVEPAASAGRVFLGIEAENVLGGGIGVRVVEVTDPSPAWNAGFKEDDRVIAVNGFAIANLDDMANQLSKTVPGQTVLFSVTRKARNIELTCVMMDAELAGRIHARELTSPPSGEPVLGVEASDLSAAFRQQFGIPVFRGAAITKTLPGSPAERAGIHAGDVIVEYNAQPIQGSNDLGIALGATQVGQAVELLVYTGSRSRLVKLVMAGKPAPVAPRTVFVPNVSAPSSSVSPTDNSREESLDPNRKVEIEQILTQLSQEQMKSAELARENVQLKDRIKQMEAELQQVQSKMDQVLKALNQ